MGGRPMKMPFPGMDPYLEHPLLWPGVHVQLMVALANQLQPLIEPRYVASLEERVYLEGAQRRRFVPDTVVKHTGQPGSLRVAAQPAGDTPVLVDVGEVEVHERCVEILDLYKG